MTKKIEFRGKRKDNGKWVYGYYSKLFDEETNKEEPIISYQHFEAADMSYPYPTVDTINAKVYEETVGQYGNRKTDKGRKIYEGDICFSETETEIGDERIYCVFTFIEEWNMFAWLNIDEYNGYKKHGVIYLSQDDWYSSDMKGMHYVGNIFDNPELLK